MSRQFPGLRLAPLEKVDDRPDRRAPIAGWRDPRRPFKAGERDRAWIFASRWLLAPMYLGLAVSLLLLLGKFVQETVELARHTGAEDVHKLITGILSLVDLSLMGNLVVMVMFAGYENFVSRRGTGPTGWARSASAP